MLLTYYFEHTFFRERRQIGIRCLLWHGTQNTLPDTLQRLLDIAQKPIILVQPDPCPASLDIGGLEIDAQFRIR